MIVALRCVRNAGENADVRRAAARSLDSWRSAPRGVTVVDADGPRGASAEWDLVVREPEALVPPDPLSEAVLAAAAGETALEPEGVFPGGIGPPEPYVTVWQFEEARKKRASGGPLVGEAARGGTPPVELRKRGSGEAPARPVSGWLVHSFAGRRSWARPELLPLVPAGVRNALEVGCAEGAFGRSLEHEGIRVTGVEPDRAAAGVARCRISRVIAATLEEASEELGGELFDLVVLADVLEHLDDPVASLRLLARSLRPGGTLLFSLPNASHAAVLAGMLQGRFDPALEGIVADDHRTYAGPAGWEQVLRAGGFAVETITPQKVLNPLLDPWRSVFVESGPDLTGMLDATQWTGTARASDPGTGPDLPSWRPAEPTVLDSDDPVAEVRRHLDSARDLRLRVPNATAGGNVLTLFDGGLAGGAARSSLARGFTAHGLEARFRGTGLRIDVRPAGEAALPEALRGLVSRATAQGLPVTPECLSASFLDVTIGKESA